MNRLLRSAGLLAAVSVLIFAASASAQCPNGRCPRPTFAPYVAAPVPALPTPQCDAIRGACARPLYLPAERPTVFGHRTRPCRFRLFARFRVH